MGCIQLINKKDNSEFTQEDVALCERLAAFVAVGIEDGGISAWKQLEKAIT